MNDTGYPTQEKDPRERQTKTGKKHRGLQLVFLVCLGHHARGHECCLLIGLQHLAARLLLAVARRCTGAGFVQRAPCQLADRVAVQDSSLRWSNARLGTLGRAGRACSVRMQCLFAICFCRNEGEAKRQALCQGGAFQHAGPPRPRDPGRRPTPAESCRPRLWRPRSLPRRAGCSPPGGGCRRRVWLRGLLRVCLGVRGGVL